MELRAAEVRAVLITERDVRLTDVRDALARFCQRWQLPLQGVQGREFGELMADGYGGAELAENSRLTLRLHCYTNGKGRADELDELCASLCELVTDEGGVIEVIDLDTSPATDDAGGLRCIGRTPESRKRALIRFAFEKTWNLLADVVPRETFDEAVELCVKVAHRAGSPNA